MKNPDTAQPAHWRFLWTAVALSAGLAACGGGSDAPAPAPAPAPSPAPTTKELVLAFLQADEKLWASAVPASSQDVFAALDGCYLNNGESKAYRAAAWDASANHDGANYLVGQKYTNVEVLAERTTTNADGSARHEIDVRYDIAYADGAANTGVNTTLIAGSSSGTPGCATPDNKPALRWLGNQRKAGASVRARSWAYAFHSLPSGSPTASPQQFRREVQFAITDPAGLAQYAIVTGPGVAMGDMAFSLKMVSPRLAREAPELRGKGGTGTFADNDNFRVCATDSAGNATYAPKADCVGQGLANDSWGIRLNAPFTASRLADQDAAFDALGFVAGSVYTVAFYNDDGWKTVNGHSGQTPVFSYTARLGAAPYSFTEMAATGRYPQISATSLDNAQIAAAFSGAGATVGVDWQAAKPPTGGAPMVLANVYSHRQASVASVGPGWRIRGSTLSYPGPAATSAQMRLEGLPAGADLTTYGDLTLQYTDRNGRWLNYGRTYSR